MKRLIYLPLFFFLTFMCQQEKKTNIKESKNKTNIMAEKFDFELYKKYQESNGTLELKNGYTILSMVPPEDNEMGMQTELLPKPSFLFLYKEFYPNGYIKKKEMRISETVKVMESEYYDEKGNLIKFIDEDTQYGKIKYQDVLNFIDKKKYINISNGKGRLNDDGTNKYDIIYNTDDSVWTILINQGEKLTDQEFLEATRSSEGEPSIWKPIEYKMDGETGKVEEIK